MAASEEPENVSVRLLEHPMSSYAQKVKIVLREKGISCKLEMPDGFASGKEYGPLFETNPRMEIPVLIDGQASIFDSTIILEYIEERWPDPALLPRDPAARAAARMIEDICDTQYEAVNWGFGEILWFNRATGEKADVMKARAAEQTKTLQDWLMDCLGNMDYFGGQNFGWADASVAPIVNRSVYYGLGPPEGSTLARWHARVRERPAVAETFREFDAAAAAMYENAHLYLSGQRKREYRDHRLEWIVKNGGLDIVANGIRDQNIRFSWPSSV